MKLKRACAKLFHRALAGSFESWRDAVGEAHHLRAVGLKAITMLQVGRGHKLRAYLQRWEIMRIVLLGFGTGRQEMLLERWTNPKLPRCACACG